MFAPFVAAYTGVDHVEIWRDGVQRVDLVASAYEVPLPDASADTVLLLEVLEHLERPEEAMREAARLLAPGGHVIATTPFFWPVHDKRDFYRYAPGGLRFLLESAGLETVAVEPLGGVWSTISLELGYALQRYRRGPLAPVVDAVAAGTQWLAVRWERVDFQPRFSWNHLAVARRGEP